MGKITPVYNQNAYRGRNDDGSETGASWKAAANTIWTQPVDSVFRLRFVIQETAGGSPGGGTSLQLYRSLNGGGFVRVDTVGLSTVVIAVNSAFVADTTLTTQQLGSGTFAGGEFSTDGSESGIGFGGNDEAEPEYCCQIVGSDVSPGDTITFHVFQADTALDNYTNAPTLTVPSLHPRLIAQPLRTGDLRP